MNKTSSKAPGRRTQLAVGAVIALAVLAGALIATKNVGPKASQAAQAAPAAAEDKHDDGHGHADEKDGAHGEAPVDKGPHGGQLIVDGDRSLEVLLSEDDGTPRLRAWTSDVGGAKSLSAEALTATLSRPNGDVELLRFKRVDGGFVSEQEVAEPHAFDAKIELQTAEKVFRFDFSKDEGKVSLSDAQIQSAGISLETSAPAAIKSSLQFPGEIRFNEDRTAHVVARVSGVVESVGANLGQQVKKGQVLAVISSMAVSDARAELQSASQRRNLAQSTYARERQLWEQKISPEQDVLQARQALKETDIAVANAAQKLQAMGATANSQSLGRFELRAPFDGVVVEKHIALGEAVSESTQTFIISDLSSVWAEMSVPARDLPRVRVGEKVVVNSGAFDAKASGTVAYVGSLIGEQTRTALARVVLPNPQGAWRPGLFVNVDVVMGEETLPVTVDASAIQTLDKQSVVFIKIPGGFLPQPVELGRTDGKRVEIVSGMKAGSSYAAAGSFVVKSEQGKGSATHTH